MPADARPADGTGVIVAYDTHRFPFAALMCAALGIDSFADLPLGDPEDPDAARRINRRFRRDLAQVPLDSPLLVAYRRFAAEVVGAHFGRPLSHTKRPVLRVQIGRSPSVSAPHRDVDYTERWDYINVWLPMVDVPAETAMRVEAGYATGDFRATPLRYGEALLFDGGALEHFSPANATAAPRVSMDFRFVPRLRSDLADRILGSRPDGVELTHTPSSLPNRSG